MDTKCVQICSNAKTIEKQKQLKVDLIEIQAKKILCVNANVNIVNQELSLNKISVGGYVFYDILYVNIDDIVERNTFKTEFNEQFDVAGIDGNNYLLIKASVLENELKTLKENSFSITSTINFNFKIFQNQEIEIVDLEENPDLCTQTENIKAFYVATQGGVNFNVGNRADLTKNFASLLDINSSLTSVDYHKSENAIICNGVICSNIFYRTTDENYPVASKVINYDFKYEIPIDSIENESIILAETRLFPDNIDTELDQENGEILLSYQLHCDYIIFNQMEVQTIIDCYSLSNEISFSNKEESSIDANLEGKFQEQLQTNIELNQDYLSIDRIVGSCNQSVLITKVVPEQDRVNFEGIAYSSIIYLSYDENSDSKQTSSIIAEMPFSFKLDLVGVEPGDEILLQANISDFDVRAKRAQELDIYAQLNISLTALKTKKVPLTRSLELGQEKSKCEYGMSIYCIDENLSAWDIAKKLSITQEQLLEQNANLTFPLSSKQKIVVYRKQNLI